MNRKNPFEINPHKANTKISVNSVMIGSLFFILTFILTVGQDRFHFLVLAELVLAIPLLYVSTLVYSKIVYSDQTELWDVFGWVVSYAGNTIILNAIGLMIASISRGLAIIYFATFLILMLIYSIINIFYNRHLAAVKVFKFAFFLVVLFFAGILPLCLMK